MSTLIIGATSVLRTLAVVAIGSFSATLLDNIPSTNSWFSVINVYIFLPCLLFGHFSTGFSTQVFEEGFALVVFGFSRMITGFVTTKLAAFFGLFDEETQPLALLATSSSNAVAIPLSMLAELSNRVDFLSPDPEFQVRDAATGNLITAKKYCETLMFVYAIPINASIWSFGQMYIRSAAAKKQKREELAEKLKKKEHQEQQQELEMKAVVAAEKQEENDKEEEKKEQENDDDQRKPVATATAAASSALQSARVSIGADLSASQQNHHDENNTSTTVVPVSSESKQQQQEEENSKQDEESAASPTTGKATKAKESSISYIFRVYVLRSLSVPLVGSFAGIAVSLIPGVQVGITGGWPLVTALSNCVILLGQAAVPSALLTVGITVFRTLTAKKPPIEDEKGDNKKVTEEVTVSASMFQTLDRKLTKFFGIHASLLFTTAFVQLIATPLIAFICIRYIFFRNDFDLIQNATQNGIFSPTENTDPVYDAEYWRRRRLMLFALLSESFCPSAMNTSIICTLYKYRSEEFSRMIVYQYILSVFTMSLLMSFYLSSFQSI